MGNPARIPDLGHPFFGHQSLPKRKHHAKCADVVSSFLSGSIRDAPIDALVTEKIKETTRKAD